MRRVWLAALVTMFAVSLSVSADRAWEFQPALPRDGTTGWLVEMQLHIDHVNIGPIHNPATPDPDGEPDALRESLEEILREYTSQIARTNYTIAWLPHDDPSLRRFTLEVSNENAGVTAMAPNLPPTISGVIDQQGNWIEFDTGEFDVSPPGFSAGGVLEDLLRSLIVPLPAGPVSAGDTWTIRSTRNLSNANADALPAELTHLPFDHEYTLVDVESRDGIQVARVRHTARMHVEDFLPVDDTSKPIVAHVKHEIIVEADLWVDTATGLVIEGAKTVHTSGYTAYLTLADAPDPFADRSPEEGWQPETAGEPFVVEDSSATWTLRIVQRR